MAMMIIVRDHRCAPRCKQVRPRPGISKQNAGFETCVSYSKSYTNKSEFPLVSITSYPTPSSADIKMTRQLRDAAQAVDIPLLDHVILGRTAADPGGLGHYSFRAAGLI